MIVNRLVVGVLQENCYIVENESEVILIDPGDNPRIIMDSLPINKKVITILLTHGHFDHIGAVNSIVKKIIVKYMYQKKIID